VGYDKWEYQSPAEQTGEADARFWRPQRIGKTFEQRHEHGECRSPRQAIQAAFGRVLRDRGIPLPLPGCLDELTELLGASVEDGPAFIVTLRKALISTCSRLPETVAVINRSKANSMCDSFPWLT
jgi:hypothetical protein